MGDAAPRATEERPWRQTVAGSLLVVFGLTVLVERITGRDLTVLPLAVGILLLISYRRTQSHASLVWGSVVSGAGMGWFLSSATGHVLGGAIFCLCTAAGFGLLFSVDGRRSAWASVAALAFLFLGAVALLFDVGDALADDAGGILFPLVLLGAGGLLLARHALPRRAVVVGLAFLLALVVGATCGNVDLDERDAETRALSLPALDGRRLIVATISGDITVRIGEPAAEVTATGRRDGATVRATDGAVRLSGLPHASFDVTVPAGSDLELRTASGDVAVQVAGDPDIEVTTVSGEIDAEGLDADPEGRRFTVDGSDGSVQVATISGDVTLFAA